MSLSPPPVGIMRVRPLRGEMTASWLERLAASYRLASGDLLRAVMGQRFPGLHRVQWNSRGAEDELIVNAPAVSRLAAFAGLPLEVLHDRLPAVRSPDSHLPRTTQMYLAWRAPSRPWITPCARCTRRHRVRGAAVRRYAVEGHHICARHRLWLLPGAQECLALDCFPDVLAAHRVHRALVRAHPHAERALASAGAVVWSWRLALKEDVIWQQRAQRLTDAARIDEQTAAAHALIFYPEVVAVARLLLSPFWQQQIGQAALKSRNRYQVIAKFRTALADSVGRPHLLPVMSDLARDPLSRTADPLHDWLEECTAGSVAEDAPRSFYSSALSWERLPHSLKFRMSALAGKSSGRPYPSAQPPTVDGWHPYWPEAVNGSDGTAQAGEPPAVPGG
ncbi:TniQ family protein [Streptomyces sp. NPDC052207]|uniref:TniQ family protein n=1 Tax=Streptomyces sp. NPDC052207 TaxID=3155418 RepID=UPI00343153FB